MHHIRSVAAHVHAIDNREYDTLIYVTPKIHEISLHLRRSSCQQADCRCPEMKPVKTVIVRMLTVGSQEHTCLTMVMMQYIELIRKFSTNRVKEILIIDILCIAI
jgi:hypothetical protein